MLCISLLLDIFTSFVGKMSSSVSDWARKLPEQCDYVNVLLQRVCNHLGETTWSKESTLNTAEGEEARTLWIWILGCLFLCRGDILFVCFASVWATGINLCFQSRFSCDSRVFLNGNTLFLPLKLYFFLCFQTCSECSNITGGLSFLCALCCCCRYAWTSCAALWDVAQVITCILEFLSKETNDLVLTGCFPLTLTGKTFCQGRKRQRWVDWRLNWRLVFLTESTKKTLSTHI